MTNVWTKYGEPRSHAQWKNKITKNDIGNAVVATAITRKAMPMSRLQGLSLQAAQKISILTN